jgi:hypothetical protein
MIYPPVTLSNDDLPASGCMQAGFDPSASMSLSLFFHYNRTARKRNGKVC